MKKIYLFWIGDESLISNNVQKLKDMGFSVEVGPSKEDDTYLTKNYEYYKWSKKQKKYSFCSDVWRHYKLSKGQGMYIDTSVEIGPNFNKLYDYATSFEVWAPRVGYKSIASAVMARGSDTHYFNSILDLLKKNKNYGDTMINWIGPHLQDYFAFSNGHFAHANSKKFIIDGICYDTIHKITDEETIYKVGTGSWFDKPLEDPRYFWKHSRDLWDKRNPTINEVEKSIRKNGDFPVINFYSLKRLFEQRGKTELKDLSVSYKKAKKESSPKFKEYLFWSKLYRFFAFRWLKSK